MVRTGRLWTVAAALVSAVAIGVGCGGGSSSGAANSGGGGGSGSGGGGTTITEAQRTAALAALDTELQTLPRQNQQADAQTLLAWFKSRPEFVHADISDDGCVWAWFPDLEPVCFVNNEFLGKPSDLLPPGMAEQRASGRSVPAGTSARLMQMFGALDGALTDPRGDLSNILKAAGYSVDSPGSTDLNYLRRVKNTDVMFTNTHGGLGYAAGNGSDSKHFWPGFCMWTDQKIDQPLDGLDSNLQNDLKVTRDAKGNVTAGPRVVRMFAAVNWVGFPNPLNIQHVEEGHYAITAQFITQYMTFNPGSIWWTNACYSASPDAAFNVSQFQNAAFGKGLSAYIGWDNEADRQGANNAVRYAFDRTAGTNLFEPTAVAHRAYPLGVVVQAMHGLSPPLDQVTGTDPQGHSVTAHLKVNVGPTTVGNAFTIFRPSIGFAGIDLPATPQGPFHLHVYGYLDAAGDGTVPTVTLGGASLPIVSHSGTELVCDMSGALHGGPVVVSVKGRSSNAVMLTQWTVQYQSSTSYTNGGNSDGTSGYSMTLSLICDIHHPTNSPTDLNPDAESYAPQQVGIDLPSSSGTYNVALTGSGAGNERDCLAYHPSSGGGALPATYSQPSSVAGPQALWIGAAYPPTPVAPGSANLNLAVDAEGYAGTAATGYSPLVGPTVTLSPSYTVIAANKTTNTDLGQDQCNYQDNKQTTTWSVGGSVQYTPDPTAAR